MTSETDYQDATLDVDVESYQAPKQQSLRDHVAEAMLRYFQDLDGQDTRGQF
jgi:DNA-binding protein Fis